MKVSISISHPFLLNEWDYEKNQNISPTDITSGSDKKVWWICSKDNTHKWEASISHRANGRNCPYCSGKKVNKSNCLGTINPTLSKQWDHDKNKEITPETVTANSTKKVWWRCPISPSHSWQAAISNRNKGRGCPYCNGNIASPTNCITYTHPEIAKEWYYQNNKGILPENISKGVVKKYWWKCPNHETHIYQASPNNRSKGKGCPFCSGRSANDSNSLSNLRPDLMLEWDYSKNIGISPKDFTLGSQKTVWWKCNKGPDHEWQAKISMRTRKVTPSGCPICVNQKTVISNSLGTIFPELSTQWSFEKNGSLTPFDVNNGSAKKVWWKCPKGDDHEWQASIRDRANGNGCPICNGFKIVKSNSLSFRNSKIALELDPIKNFNITAEEIYYLSQKKYWWKCNKGPDHEWITSVYHRTKNNSNCPFCTLTPQSRQELSITFELITIFNSINPKGFKTKIQNKIWSIDIFIPELNLGIEFDGSHWHKDKLELDKLKTKQLNLNGFKIIRIREQPLKATSEFDIVVSNKFDLKSITTQLLNKIARICPLTNEIKDKINLYINSPSACNQKELDKYIEQILLAKSKTA
jgi:hypothetical protein